MRRDSFGTQPGTAQGSNFPFSSRSRKSTIFPKITPLHPFVEEPSTQGEGQEIQPGELTAMEGGSVGGQEQEIALLTIVEVGTDAFVSLHPVGKWAASGTTVTQVEFQM